MVRELSNLDKLSKEYVVSVAEQYNEIEEIDDEIPTTGSVEHICRAFVKSMNSIEEEEFVELCELRKFEGDIEDLYEVLTDQKIVEEHMLPLPGEIKEEKKKEAPVSPVPASKSEKTQTPQAGKDKYGFRISSASSKAMKLAEAGKYTAKEIADRSDCSNVYGVFKRVNDHKVYIVAVKKQNRKSIICVEPT